MDLFLIDVLEKTKALLTNSLMGSLLAYYYQTFYIKIVIMAQS